jgi:hypothetical protein
MYVFLVLPSVLIFGIFLPLYQILDSPAADALSDKSLNNDLAIIWVHSGRRIDILNLLRGGRWWASIILWLSHELPQVAVYAFALRKCTVKQWTRIRRVIVPRRRAGIRRCRVQRFVVENDRRIEGVAALLFGLRFHDVKGYRSPFLYQLYVEDVFLSNRRAVYPALLRNGVFYMSQLEYP